MQIQELVKLLFHGTKDTNPTEILSSEYGLDNRFAKAGLYGTGIYFADNAHYCYTYKHNINYHTSQMLVCFVITGESVQLTNQDKSLHVPPFKDMANKIRYDSVRNDNGSHYIIYDYNKQYPGYLITFTH